MVRTAACFTAASSHADTHTHTHTRACCAAVLTRSYHLLDKLHKRCPAVTVIASSLAATKHILEEQSKMVWGLLMLLLLLECSRRADIHTRVAAGAR